MASRSLPNPSKEQNKAVIAAKVTIINQPIEVKLFGTQGKALDRLVVLFTNVSDNLYNIAGIMEAQLTSLKDTEDALRDSMAAATDTENQQLEARREGNKSKEKEKKEPKNPFQKLIDFFEGLINILIPFIVGFVIGIKKELALIAAVVLLFRRQVFAVLGILFGVLKKLPGIILSLAGFLKRAIPVAINILSKAFKTLSTKFPSLIQNISSALNKLPGIILSLAGFLKRATTGAINILSKAFKTLSTKFPPLIENISKFFSKFFSKITSGFKSLGPVSGFVDKFVKAAKAVFTSMGAAPAKFASLAIPLAGATAAAVAAGASLTPLQKNLEKLDRLFKPLLKLSVVITAVLALFKGITQAFEGFEKEGIFGAIKGLTAGIVSSLVGWVGDLGAFLVGKLLSLLGFEELGERIASLDFTEMLNQTIMGLFDGVSAAFTDMFDKLSGGYAKIFSGENIIGGIVDVFSALPGLLIDLITSPFEALGEAIKEVFNFDLAALAKKFLIAIAPPDSLLGKILGTGKMQAEVAASDAAMAKRTATQKPIVYSNKPAEQAAPITPAAAPGKPAERGQTTTNTPPSETTETTREISGTIEFFADGDYRDLIDAEAAAYMKRWGIKPHSPGAVTSRRVAVMRVKDKLLTGEIEPRGETKVTITQDTGNVVRKLPPAIPPAPVVSKPPPAAPPAPVVSKPPPAIPPAPVVSKPPGAAPGKPADSASKGTLTGFTPVAYKDEIEAESKKLIDQGMNPANARTRARMKVTGMVASGKLPLRGGAAFEGTRTDEKGNVSKISAAAPTPPAPVVSKPPVAAPAAPGEAVWADWTRNPESEKAVQFAEGMAKTQRNLARIARGAGTDEKGNVSKISENRARMLERQAEAFDREASQIRNPMVRIGETGELVPMTEKQAEELNKAFPPAKVTYSSVATAPQGTAMNADSQNVAGAPRGGGGSSQNVVAPVTTTNVNNSQSQNVSIRPNATPTFGMSNSGTGTMTPVFGF